MGLKLEEVVGKKLTEEQFDEAAGKKDACYHKVKARYDVWPSAYASGALVKCRKVGAANWGNKSKKKEGVNETPQMAKQGQVGLLLKLANKQLQNVFSLHKKGKNKEAKVVFNNKVYSTLEYIHRAFDNVNESVNEAPDHDLAMKFKKVDDTILKLISRYKNKANVEAIVNSWMKGLHAKLKKQGIHESVKKSINEANYTHNYPSITAMAKDYKRIFPSTGPAGGVKIISGSKREATGKRSQPAFIRIEGDKKLIDAYKKIAFNGRGNYSDVIKSLKEGLADKFKKNIDKYNKKAKKSRDYLKKLKKKESVEEAYDIWAEDGSFGYTMTGIVEAEYGGRKVKLGKPMQGDVKKFKVYVKNPKGNVVKVNFGHGGSSAKGKTMKIRKSNPKARANFRARHNCDNPGPRHKARYWSCRKW